MSSEQNNLRGIKPFCAFCYRKKERVKVLAEVHGKYICDDCCDAINSKMNEPVDTPPDNELSESRMNTEQERIERVNKYCAEVMGYEVNDSPCFFG